MGQFVPLSIRSSSDRASSSSPFDATGVNTDPSRISAEIVKIGKTPLPKLRHSVREDFKRMFWAAFDGHSLNAKCVEASRWIDASADTFARIYSDDTAKIDFALALAVAAIYQARPGANPVQFAGLIIRATVEASA